MAESCTEEGMETVGKQEHGPRMRHLSSYCSGVNGGAVVSGVCSGVSGVSGVLPLIYYPSTSHSSPTTTTIVIVIQ